MTISSDLASAVEKLIEKAPPQWLASTCQALRGLSATTNAEGALRSMPTTSNSDLAFMLRIVVQLAAGRMSWEALGWSLDLAHSTYTKLQSQQQVELLWSGPAPDQQIPARRIDQALYDQIASARSEILLVTFAAARIQRLSDSLVSAAERGVSIRMILEFEATSEGQLSYDAMRAFPAGLIATVDVYHWPVEKRERNQAGWPGKLHAKLAIIDDTAIVSSANLTDDAFNRNLEVGVKVRAPDFLASIRGYLNALIADGTLVLLA